MPSSKGAAKLVEQQIAIAYGDRSMLDEELKKIFADEPYKVKIKCGFFHLQVPRELSREQINNINAKIRAHYQTQYEEF